MIFLGVAICGMLAMMVTEVMLENIEARGKTEIGVILRRSLFLLSSCRSRLGRGRLISVPCHCCRHGVTRRRSSDGCRPLLQELLKTRVTGFASAEQSQRRRRKCRISRR